jgi:hypothetical protein
MDADGLEFDQQNAAETSRPTKCNRTLLRICARFSVRSLFFFVLMIAAFLAGRQSRELYPSLWFLGRTRPSIPPQTAYVDSGSTLYVATSGNVPRLMSEIIRFAMPSLILPRSFGCWRRNREQPQFFIGRKEARSRSNCRWSWPRISRAE